MSDLAPTGAAHELDLADTERWKIVMEHKPFGAFSLEIIQALFIFRGTERGGHEGLGLTPGEESRSVSPWQDANLGGDRSNILERPPVRPLPLFQDHSAQLFVLDLLKQPPDGDLPIVRLGAELAHDFVKERLPTAALLLLLGDPGQGPKPLAGEKAHTLAQLRIRRWSLEGRLFNPKLFRQIQYHVNHELDPLMPKLDRLHHQCFRDLIGSSLKHDHIASGPRNNDIDVRPFHLGIGWIEDQLAVHPADPGSPNRPEERDRRDTKSSRGTQYRQDVGVIILIGG